MVKITLGKLNAAGKNIKGQEDFMTLNTSPSKINSYLKQLKDKKRNARRRQLRRLNPKKYLDFGRKYVNNEVAWIKNLFSSIRRRTFAKDVGRQRKIALGHYNLYFTKDQLLHAWKEHKKKYGGMFCGYTGELMTHLRSDLKDPLRNQSLNISVDRLDPEKPYTLDNIIFCTVKFNNKKGSIGYKDCLAILQKFIELGKQ